MSRIAHRRFSMLFVALVTACGSATGPGGAGGPIFGGIGGLGGGYTGMGGLAGFDQHLDPQFIYLYESEFISEGPLKCDTQGYCGLGGLTNKFGTVAEADSFLFVSTANVFHNGADRVNRNSGIQSKTLTIANPTQYSAARVSFEFVFATARLNPTSHNDSAIVRIKAGTDSATIFKMTSADLQSARFTARSGGCGTATIIALRPIAYPDCTAWVATTADITPYMSRNFVLQFIVGEDKQSSTDFLDQPTAFLLRKIQLEAAK